jgi:predicted RNase H-like HicB family nuclease
MAASIYRVLVHYDSDKLLYVARAPELEHCTAEGQTRAEAVAKVEEEILAQVQNIREQGGRVPPAAVDDLAAHTGELTARVSRLLSRDLAWQARLEGVSVDQLVGEMLAGAMAERQQRGTRRVPAENRAPVASPRVDGEDSQPMSNAGANERFAGPRGPVPQGRDGGRRGMGGGGRYHAIMEDRATFLEYVRGLEQGGPSYGQPRAGGGDNRRRRDRGRGPSRGGPGGTGGPSGPPPDKGGGTPGGEGGQP